MSQQSYRKITCFDRTERLSNLIQQAQEMGMRIITTERSAKNDNAALWKVFEDMRATVAGLRIELGFMALGDLSLCQSAEVDEVETEMHVH